jgi:hypothetical protein
MFEKIKNKYQKYLAELENIKGRITSEFRIKLETFNDPKALEVEWIPLKRGGANFKTNSLIKESPTRYKYQLSKGSLAFFGLFLAIGLVVMLVGLVLMFKNYSHEYWFLILFGLVFSTVGFLLLKITGKSKTFDSAMGIIWFGKKQPKFSGDHANNKTTMALIYFSKVHAMQILSERVRGKNSSYISYELNLILIDGKRINLVDHGNISQIRVDAQKLSRMMGVPVWDVS